LRFDYDGTGDSAGDDTDPDRLQAWIDSVREAIECLRSTAKVDSVCILGIRLGATLALLASQSRTDVSGLVLINPVTSGRRYLRELRALGATSSAIVTEASTPADIQEAAGFISTASTRESLGALMLSREQLHTVPQHTLILDRTDLPVDGSLATLLEAMGSVVHRMAMPGYAAMLRDAQDAVVPTDSIGQVLQWLQEWSGASAPASVSGPVPIVSESLCQANMGGLRERVVNLGSDTPVFGIVTEPEGGPRDAPTLLLLNAGAVHHIGPNRLYVQFARHLARRGIRVARIDLPGLGDSPATPGQPEHRIYLDGAEQVIAQVVESLRTELAAGEIHCAGICSGAYHSLKAAGAGVPLDSVIVINPLTFFWRPDMSLEAPAFKDIAEVMRYRRTALSAKSLRKLLTGRVDLLNLAGIFSRFALRRARSIGRQVCRMAGISIGDDLVIELRRIQRRGTRMHFVFARSDPGYSLLRDDAGSEIGRLTALGALTISFIEDADHTFTPFPSQVRLIELVTAILTGQPPLLS